MSGSNPLHDSTRRIAEARRDAESGLKAALAAIPDSEKVEDYLPAFCAFAKSLLDAEAEQASTILDEKEAYQRFLKEVATRIIEGILPDQGLASVKANWTREVARLSIEHEVDSEILSECRPDGTIARARAEIQGVHAQHGDWENFAPLAVRFRLRFENNALVRENLRQALERKSFYWLGRFSLRPPDPSRPYGTALEAMPELQSWKDLQTDFLQYAREHAGLRAIWAWKYTRYGHSLLGLPEGHWVLDGGSPSSQHLFREIANRASGRLSNPPSQEPWRSWLDQLRVEGYARKMAARKVSPREFRAAVKASGQPPLPKGFESEQIENVFKSSAEFCHVRSLAGSRVDSSGVAEEHQSKLTQEFKLSEHVLIKGPDDVELVVERYPNGYVWKIRNGSLQAIKQPGLEIVSTQSFDAKKLAFREPIASGVAWVSRRLPAGEVTKSTILVRIEGDHLELGDTIGMHELSWPSGDAAIDRRWALTMRVIGLSQEWPLELDVL